MYEVYVLVARKRQIKDVLLASLFLALGVVSLLLACAFPAAIGFSIIFIALWVFLQFYSNKEFEYSFFDGELRFAKVMNKSRRKSLKTFTMNDVLQIAPAGDRSVYRYETDTNVKVIDYTSGIKDVPYYEMVFKNNDQLFMIKFEPDEKYLDAICVKYSQKVIKRA